MSRMPDLIGYELEKGLDYLRESGLAYKLVETTNPRGEVPAGLPKRIIRSRRLPSGEIEIVYSVDTYQLKKERHL